MKKKMLFMLVVLVLACVAYLGVTATSTVTNQVAVASGPSYSATVYVAGMGGHFAKAEVTVDPSDEAAPVKVTGLDRVVIGDKGYATHDARIDVKDRNTLFWSTYVLDANGKVHVGKSDLKTGNVIMDVAMDPDPRAPGKKGPLYCASGQSEKYFMPVFMGTEGYVDVIDKKSMKLKERVFVKDLGYAPGSYKFLHGINSPDMKTFVLALNQAGADGKGNGKIDFILVDMKKLEKGKLKQIAKVTHTGEPEKTITFRGYFSNNGKNLLWSAGDRLWVLDAKTLAMVDEKMVPGGQLHDAMATPDDKYAVLTVRSVTEGCDAEGKPIAGKDITDGVLMVYDATAKKISDKSVSVCLGCHKGMGLGDKSAVLCGLDANYKN